MPDMMCEHLMKVHAAMRYTQVMVEVVDFNDVELVLPPTTRAVFHCKACDLYGTPEGRKRP